MEKTFYVLLATILFGLVAIANPAFAENIEHLDVSDKHVELKSSSTVQSAETIPFAELFGLEHREFLYEKTKLQYGTALGYSLLLPGMGNIYAEQYFMGGLSFVTLTFSALFLAFGLNTSNPQFLWLGGGLGALTYGGAVTTSLLGVQRFNYRLRQSLGLMDEFAALESQLPRMIGYSFRF